MEKNNPMTEQCPVNKQGKQCQEQAVFTGNGSVHTVYGQKRIFVQVVCPRHGKISVAKDIIPKKKKEKKGEEKELKVAPGITLNVESKEESKP